MNIDIDSVIDMILSAFGYIADFTVTVGGVTFSLINFFLAFIVVDVIILFVKAFTSSKGGDNSG